MNPPCRVCTRFRPPTTLRLAVLSVSLATPVTSFAQTGPSLAIGRDGTGEPVLSIDPGAADTSAVLEATAAADPGSGPDRWVPVWGTHGPVEAWPDPDQALHGARLYRLTAAPTPDVPPHATWKNRLSLPDDPFLADPIAGSNPGGFGGPGGTQWVKFTLYRDDPLSVYFQDSEPYPFHYEFATERLPGFLGLSRGEFDQATLAFGSQQAVLGAVLVNEAHREFAVQFVGSDPVPRESVAFFYDRVAAALDGTGEMRGFYFPAPEQFDLAERERGYLASRGVAVGAVSRWVVSDQCYADGWAIGRIVAVPGPGIAAAYRDGTLGPADILLTDRVPAEIPFVAGVLATEPATPNSHAVLLAQAWGIPFAHVSGEAQAAALADLAGAGTEVLLQAGGPLCVIEQIPLPDAFPETLREDLDSRKVPPPLELQPVELTGELWRTVDGLTPADTGRFGGKASNFGLLRRVLPDNSPSPAIAFSFDLWDAYLAQPVPGEGRPLREAIAARLAGTTWPPADFGDVLDRLAEVRSLVRNGPVPATERDEVLAALATAGFDPDQKIRFRSSTNVEDSASFVGAGLYDSFSGCLRDDLDGDDSGPSHCDPDEAGERGVLRAIRRVFASFYNDNAYLERLRRGVDEDEVGMALLVHHSFPDHTELANGVATLTFAPRFGGGFQIDGELVSQDGAVSVTNPDGSAEPEIVLLTGFESGGNLILDVHQTQRSSLLQLGRDWVLEGGGDAGSEYRQLADLLYKTGQAYATLTGRDRFTLDFEYKKTVPGDLVVKQVREVPGQPDDTGSDPPVLIGSPVELQLFQGEAADVFANHRLKSRWRMTGHDRLLDGSGFGSSLVADATWTHLLDGETSPEDEPGAPSTKPGATFDAEGTDRTLDGWDGSSWEGGTTRFILETHTGTFGIPGPGRTVASFTVFLHANYSQPVAPNAEFDGDELSDTIRLEPARPTDGPLPAGSIHITRETEGATIQFWWPPAPTGVVAGYTAPLERWDQTTLTGLTTEPIVLRGYWSQTYRPGHHNFSEEFVFEPRLEEGIAPAIIAELESKDIRLVYVAFGHGPDDGVHVSGADGKLRRP